MSRLDRKKLQSLLLKEMRMLGMAPMGGVGHMQSLADDMPMGHHDDEPAMHDMHDGMMKGTVSREDCCAAILCMIECCECPATRKILKSACMEVLGR